MLSWLRKKIRKNSRLDDWHFGDLSGYELIVNEDSIQYLDEAAERVIYLSTLLVSGSGPLVDLTTAALANGTSIEESNGGWVFKGKRAHANVVLVCAISVSKKADLVWAESFFNSIRHKEVR